MKKIIPLFFILISLVSGVKAQGGIDRWNREILLKANTARDFPYINEEEKKLILLINLARTDGKLFSETYLDNYLKNEKQTRYTRSLYRELVKIKNLPLLKPSEDLYYIAQQHAEKSGKKGTTGHQGFEKRYTPILGKYEEVGENCAYGYNSAEDILIQLLIDEEIPDLGHRKNLLNPGFDAIGLSIENHKKYRYNCVMSFGKSSK